MPDISITAEGIDKVLVDLNPLQAAGPDKFKPFVRQTLHKALAPVLQLIFKRNLDTGDTLKWIIDFFDNLKVGNRLL